MADEHKPLTLEHKVGVLEKDLNAVVEALWRYVEKDNSPSGRQLKSVLARTERLPSYAKTVEKKRP